MNWYRVFYDGETPIEVQASNEKDAIFQASSRLPLTAGELVSVEEFLPAVKPIFVRVHLGFITVNLIPEIAEKLVYKEGDRFSSEQAMFHAIAVQNIHIVEMWYKDRNENMPTDINEAAKFMIESTLNQN